MKRYDTWMLRRQIYRRAKPYKARKAWRLYAIARMVGDTVVGYWRGEYRADGLAFTHDLSRARKFRHKKQAWMAVNNSDMYKYGTYRVIKVKKSLLG